VARRCQRQAVSRSLAEAVGLAGHRRRSVAHLERQGVIRWPRAAPHQTAGVEEHPFLLAEVPQGMEALRSVAVPAELGARADRPSPA